MREKARDRGRIKDIVDYAGNVSELIEGITFEQLIADKRYYYSVIKNIEIVGEAAYMVTNEYKKAYPEIPWKIVAGMRHILVHDYANIDDEELYNTAVNDIPAIRALAQKYLDETDWAAWEAGENVF